MKSISIIIPVYNEEGSIGPLIEETKKVCLDNRYDHEIIVIDDGSADNSLEILKRIPDLTLVVLRKNFGQTAAIDAGIRVSTKEMLIMLDGDGQNDPADIPRLLEHFSQNNLDVVSGWRKNRQDSFSKKIVSLVGSRIRRKLIDDGVKDSGCTLKVYRRECFDELTLYGEMHRFIPALLKIRGFRIGELIVNHRPRTTGKTHYDWKRTIKASIDLLSVWFWNKYAARPLHFLGAFGFGFITLGSVAAAITIHNFIQGQGMSETAWPLLTVFFFLGGIQFFISGLLFDIAIKNYHETNQIQHYKVRETLQT